MSFKFNFTNEDLDLDESEEQPLETSLGDLSLDNKEELNKVPSQEYDILNLPLPRVIQADIVQIPQVTDTIYKRTLEDVKFQMAEQDMLGEEEDKANTEVVNMLNLGGNTDLIRGVYEGGFKTWECSVDMVQYLASLPEDQVTNKRILELGCGSSLPSLYLLRRHESNKVDVQDYNDQVLRYITIPNILLNTVLTVEDPTTNNLPDNEKDEDESEDDDVEEEDEEEEEEEEIIEHTCDGEAEIPTDKISDILGMVSKRTRAFMGDWSSLPEQLNIKQEQDKYDIIITSETIYAEHALPDLINVIQKSLHKPNGVW
ncbi:hypothetical protein K501DRAFT_182357 [Backusella circina FSU 941]|nr:hypothetical protein K501DRAFT_182357 [Backusella circina FSU 941]